MTTTLKIGTVSAEVGNWQRFLNQQALADWDDRPLVDDEVFGGRTDFVTKRWQRIESLTPTGTVSALDRARAKAKGFIPFIQARNYTRIHPQKRAVDLIVIHTMENAEKPSAAEDVALWFAGLTKYDPPRASAHYNIDQDSTVQSVRDMDVAWHAPGTNHNGIGIEHAGRAAQTALQWNDEPSRAILERSALLAARLSRLYAIPVLKLSVDDLQHGLRGFIGHVDATLAFPGKSRTHTDPGPNFPWQQYLSLVRGYLAG